VVFIQVALFCAVVLRASFHGRFLPVTGSFCLFVPSLSSALVSSACSFVSGHVESVGVSGDGSLRQWVVLSGILSRKK